LKRNTLYGLALMLCLFACSTKEQSAFTDLETVSKDELFRASITTGAFAKLSAGFTCYEYQNPEADTLLVLVHGFSVPSYIWDSTYQAAVKRGYGALRYDNFGRGNSDNPDVVYDAALFSHQLKELLDELKITKPIHLVGLSDGGRTISSFAFQYPEKIKTLTYVDAVGFETLPDTATYPAQVMEEEIQKFKQNRYPTMAKGQMTDFYDSVPFRGWDKQYEKLMAHKGFVRALISTNKNRRNLEREHQKIVASGIPVFAIWGESDTVVQLSEVQDDMLKRIPAIQLYVIPKAGHLPHMEQTAQFNSILFEIIIKSNSK
jgi:pimeloyl-ACP methyl ester carboxylesterase